MSIQGLLRTPITNPDGTLTPPWQRAIQEGSIFSGGLNGGVISVPSSPAPQFNAQSENPAYFEFQLTSAVTSSSIIGTFAGQVVVFGILQDLTGWPFVWPPNVKNAGVVDTGASKKSFQTFIVSSDGNLYPMTAMTIN